MIISSMVLFFRRDCAGGAGPAVDCPRAEAPVPAVAPGAAVVVVALPSPADVVVAAGWVEGVEVTGLLNKPMPEAAGCVAEGVGAVVVAAVPGVETTLVFAPPNPPNREPPVGAAAGVEDGAAEDVAPPTDGKSDFCGVAVDVAGAPWEG